MAELFHTHAKRMPDSVELAQHMTSAHGYSSSNELEMLSRTHEALHARMWPDDSAPITISLEIELDLAPDEAWPDRDWPESWTAADVLKLITSCGTTERFLRDWNAAALGAAVTVHARGGIAHGNLR